MTDHLRSTGRLCRAAIIAVGCAWLVSVQTLSGFAQQQQDDGLPQDFRPPPPTPKELSIEKPLITDEEADDWGKERAGFQDALSGKVNPENQKIIERGFRINIYELSLPERRNELTDLRKAIVRYVDQFVPNNSDQMKRLACRTVVKYATDLLDGNFHVRSQAIQLIGELNITPESPSLPPDPPVACIDGLPVLLDVIHPGQGDIEQPEPLRILAALGAKRLLKHGRQTLKPNSKLPVEAARAILAELEGQGSDWYHLRLAEALIQTGLSTVPNAQNEKEPLIVEALARILANPRRPYRLRARAGYLLGRAPMPGGINAAPIAYSIVKLTQQIAEARNEKKVNGLHALFLLQDIYLAFKADVTDPTARGKNKPREKTTDGRKLAGLTSTLNQQPIQKAYEDILPIVRSIFRQYQKAPSNAGLDPTFAVGLVENLNAWPRPESMSLSQGRVDISKPLQKSAPPTKQAAPPQAARSRQTANAG